MGNISSAFAAKKPAPPFVPLTLAEQEEFLIDLRGTILDNLKVTSLVFGALVDFGRANLPSPAATVVLRSQGKEARIEGQNCGLFVIPVATMAALDCRRSLEFFGLKCDDTSLYPFKHDRRDDDIGIEHFGLPRVTREQLLSVCAPNAEAVLVKFCRWADKRVAHFTKAMTTPRNPNIPSVREIRDAADVMIEAYIHLLYKATGRPPPKLNPSD
jgi:hypothetical protein